jgi:Holliday junction resolvase RusA-like endonuclease
MYQEFTLKGNPKSTQRIYRFTCRGNFPSMYMTAEGKQIKETYQWELKSQKAKLFKGDISLSMEIFFNTKGKHDIDNFNKLILDAGTGILWEDDNQIVSLNITKYYDKENPRIDLVVETM